MKTRSLASLSALLAIAGAAHGAPHFVGAQSGRDNALVTPAPYPSDKVDDVAREANSREWVTQFPVGSRTPVNERQYGDPGRAAYGASAADADTIILARVNHVSIAINPWVRIGFSANGGVLEDLEYARHLWLKENGFVESVRTFRNPLYFGEQAVLASAAATGLPEPRATIRINDEMPDRPEKMRVMAPMHGARVSVPEWARFDGPPTVIVGEPAVEIASGE